MIFEKKEYKERLNKVKAEMRNLETLKSKWANSKFYKTLDEVVND